MKVAKVTFLFVMAALVAVGVSTTAYAFHSGGVAECEGCHSMHSPKAGGSFLLIGSDQSSTCLSCHEHAGDTGPTGYHIGTPLGDLPGTSSPKQRTPGGDFGWLRKDFAYSYTDSATGVTTNYRELGASHGHNIIAADAGYVVDPDKATAPGGGTFPSASLSCTSCHDPHGQNRRLTDGSIVRTGLPIKGSGSYNTASSEPTATEAVGVYRLLAGPGYTQSGVTGITFTGVPPAKVPSSYNMSEAANQVRVAYGIGSGGTSISWGAWCATCHPGMHNGTGNYTHPVDQQLGSTIQGFYNTYVKSGDLSGSAPTAFSSLVPFATAGTYSELALLANTNATSAGPAASTAQVMCLSCHRAHASGMAEALRFDQGYEFMTKASEYIGSDNPAVGTTGRGPLQSRGRTIAEWKAAYYDRPATQFATYQRALCNKCHAKD